MENNSGGFFKVWLFQNPNRWICVNFNHSPNQKGMGVDGECLCGQFKNVEN